MVSAKLLETVARSKGLVFEFSANNQAWVTLDRPTGIMLAEYSDITVELMTERQWREEFNKLKASKYK